MPTERKVTGERLKWYDYVQELHNGKKQWNCQPPPRRERGKLPKGELKQVTRDMEEREMGSKD